MSLLTDDERLDLIVTAVAYSCKELMQLGADGWNFIQLCEMSRALTKDTEARKSIRDDP